MGALGVAELVMVVVVVFIIVLPFWKIFSKAGFPPALSLLMLLPLINILMLFYLGFAEWPRLRQAKKE
ncbi:MAG: hypothetical protein AB1714_04845 [Acidobacteriota bacterium]